MDVRIEKMAVQPTVFMRRVGAYGMENFKLMESLKRWAGQKGLLEHSTIYGIARDAMDTPPEACRYDVCLAVPADYPADECVQKGEIPGGSYAVFTMLHTAEAVQEFWGSVFSVLQEKGLKMDEERPILERYQYHLVEEGKCEFCVPIR